MSYHCHRQQSFPHPDDRTTQSTVTPGFKPFTVRISTFYSCYSESGISDVIDEEPVTSGVQEIKKLE